MADLVSATGVASASLYAAFGSKEDLFREAVGLYEAGEGGFADRALAEEPTVHRALERLLREAATLYTRPGRPRGCMVVVSATTCTPENDAVRRWLAGERRARTASIVARLRRAVADGELAQGSDAQALGDHFAVVLHGFALQARDGVSRARLLATIPAALRALGARSLT